MKLEERIKRIIAERLRVRPGEVVPEADIVEDLGADSLDTMELVTALEEEFGFKIPNEEAERMQRVKDVIGYIKQISQGQVKTPSQRSSQKARGKTGRKSASNRQTHTLEKVSPESLPEDFELSDEFVAGFNAIEKTQKNIYITGEAGTGKTTLLKYFRQNTKKNFVVLAPTGIAAINSCGQTIHSFFKFPLSLIQPDHIRRVYNARDLFSKLELLIVDEASMMSADLMDGIDHALRTNRDKMNVPFGGVQIVVFGDLFQLPPIIGKELAAYYGQLYETPYFFSAHVFKKVQFNLFNLKKIYRQKDTAFILLLNKIRNRTLSDNDLALLNSRVQPGLCDWLDCITLTPTNGAANAINEAKLEELTGKWFVYKARIKGEFDEASYPTETHLKLKVGAQVLMIRNDPEWDPKDDSNKPKRWVNGSIGEIIDLEEDQIMVKIGNEVHDVTEVVWEKIKYKYDKGNGRIIGEVVGSFEQYPVKLAWAITIHKSQGLTFDRVIVDLDRGAFTHGQVYVALSRCRSFEELVLKRPVAYSDIIFDDRIYNLADYFQNLQ